MREEFSHKDFEKQLKDSADNFMPEPSDRVWAGIHEQLHPRRHVHVWWWAAGILLLLAVGLYVWQYPGLSPAKHPPGTAMNNPVSSGHEPGRIIPSRSRQKKMPPVQRENRVSGTGKENRGGSPASRVLNSRSADKAAGRKMAGVVHENSDISLQPVVRRQQQEVAGLPVLPNLQPDLSPDFTPGVVKYTPSFSRNPAQAERILTLRRQDSLGFAKKTVPAGLQQPSKKKPVLEISFTPAVGYRTLKVASPRAVMADPNMGAQQLAFTLPAYRASREVGIRQHPDYGWTVAAGIALPLGKRWFFRPGISLTKTGYSILAYDTYPVTIRSNGRAAYADRGTNSFYTVSPAVTAVSKLSYVHNRYLATEIPLLFGRQFGNPDKVTFTIDGGVGVFYLIASDPVIYSPDSKRYFTDKKYLHPFNGNLHLETSINIPLNDKFQISLGPSLQYQIFSSYKDYSQVKEHPYLLGLKTGLQLR